MEPPVIQGCQNHDRHHQGIEDDHQDSIPAFCAAVTVNPNEAPPQTDEHVEWISA
jgi:hypothetical protein